MKRLGILIAIPVALILVSVLSNRASSSSNVFVEMESNDVEALRGTVISRLRNIGAIHVGEETTFSGSSETELEFLIPVLRVEETLQELQQVDGTITKQRVDLGIAGDETGSLNKSILQIQECLDGVSETRSNDAIDAVAQCQSSVQDLYDAQPDDADVVENATMTIAIHPVSTTSGATIVMGIICIALFVALGVAGMLSFRRRSVIDLANSNDDLLEEIRIRQN